MGSPLGVPGNAGCFAGVLPSLRAKGIPAVTTTDGPSGIRLSACCSLIPIGTLLASSFDEELVEKVYSAVSDEMADKGSDVLLGNDEHVDRRLRFRVMEAHDLLVFVDDIRRDVMSSDHTKDTICHVSSFPRLTPARRAFHPYNYLIVLHR